MDAEAVKNAEGVLKQKQVSFTEVINLYFKAISKDASILDQVEKIATQRTGGFIGLLNNQVGDMEFKQMKKIHHEDIS
ncbi:hypothetical protein [Candidatus Nitrosacidococcus sp. I8]|uniref:hypothetical protein n=1 Tax=Candidatus Nitrosacidococcus sp. I8 TaxID=2942908 RepID=UPI0022265644|nr:hypothetical protein [Candidatus Nitrosacidococcus sp. I8]CAH9016996.1 hypothetical protein NURINAE_00276 [Candidatus Nitrosacidococcus sp. I8]